MVSFIPPDKNESFTNIVLDSNVYLFKFSYNYVGGFWTMGIYEDKDTPIIAGIKIVPYFPLNGYLLNYIDLPNGILVVDSKLETIGRKDFVDGNAKFIYMSVSEMKELIEEAING